MDIILVPLTDIVKHYVQTTYLTFDDQKLNLLLYTFIGAFCTLLLKIICNPAELKKSVEHIGWFIAYRILKKEHIEFSLRSGRIYTPYTVYDTSTWYGEIIHGENTRKYDAVFHMLGEKSYGDSKERTYQEWLNEDREYIKQAVTNWMCSKKKFAQIAFVDGYPIGLVSVGTGRYIDYMLVSPSDLALRRFIRYVKSLMDEGVDIPLNGCVLEPTIKLDSNNKKEIKLEKVGNIKRELTFDSYVSRHKELILSRLDAFKRGELYPDNPYMNNNIGMLVYGGYGTGKTFLASAVANYLGRNIVSVNFAKIKTRTGFRELMKDVEKYVYVFDEFDYLLTKLFEKPERGDNGLHTQIGLITQQINACKNPETSQKLVTEMRELIEQGNSDEMTYEFLLSELSGLTSVQDRVIIATTNFIDRIPDALKRPGRLDTVLMFDRFNREETVELATKMFKLSERDTKRLNAAKIKENRWTPSELILKRCELQTFDRFLNFIRYN